MTTYDDYAGLAVPTPAERAAEAMLDEWLDGVANELEPPADQEQADRLLGALRRVRRRRAEVVAVASARIEQVQAWLADVDGPLTSRENHLTAMLEGWAQQTHEDTGRKTWKLPAGDLKVRPRLVTAEWLGGADEIDGVANVVPAAVKTEQRVLPGEVKKLAKPGEHWPEYDPMAPEGRAALHAEVDGTVVPGVVLFVPVAGRLGRQFAAVTK